MTFDEYPEGFECIVEGRCAIPGAEIEVQSFRWTRPQEVTLVTPDFFIDLSLPYNARDAMGRFVDASETRYRKIGELFVVPADTPMHNKWSEGRKRSVNGLLKLDELAGGDHISWGDVELAAALNIKNLFLREAMARLAREVLSPSFASEIMVESLCRAVAVEVQRHFGLIRRQETGISDRLAAAHLRRVEDRVLEPGLTAPTISELAAECEMHPRRFAKLFRDTTGETVTHYVANHRLSLAKTALYSDGASIKQVSHLAGFRSVSAFSVAFKRMTGMTPREFRSSVSSEGPH